MCWDIIHEERGTKHEKHAQTGLFFHVWWSRGLEKVPNMKNVSRQVCFSCSVQAEDVVEASKEMEVIIWMHWWLGVSK